MQSPGARQEVLAADRHGAHWMQGQIVFRIPSYVPPQARHRDGDRQLGDKQSVVHGDGVCCRKTSVGWCESPVLTEGWRLKESSVQTCQVCVWVFSPGQRTGEDGRQLVHLVTLAVLWQRTKMKADHFEKELHEERLLCKVDERLSSMEHTMKVKKVETQKQFQDIHNKEEDLIDKLIASSDLESAEKCLAELEFGKVDENDEEIIFYCRTCFENNPPPASDKNVTGCFTIDLRVVTLQKLEKPDQQPRALRALKSNIKRHVVDTLAHKHKMEEKQKR